MWFTVLITPLISSNLSCRSLYCLSCDLQFWLPLWYLQTLHCLLVIDYPFDIFKLFWSLYCRSCDLPFWLPFDIFKLFLLVIVLPVDIFKLFLLVIVLPVMWYLQTFLVGHCIACHVSYRSELFLLVDLPLISSNLSCRSFWYLQTFLVGHCIACHVIYRSDYPFDIFKLFLLVIVLPVMWFTVLITPLISSNFSCWSLYCLSCDLPLFWLLMWFTVLITPLISSNFSCWSLYCLSCELPFWLPLWYLQTFLVGHCISCHVIYRSDYPFDIFKLFLLVIAFPVMWFTVLITPLIPSSFSCWSLYSLSCDLPFWLPLWYLQTFLVGHCIACHVSYRSD